jgi:hypothetical protein
MKQKHPSEKLPTQTLIKDKNSQEVVITSNHHKGKKKIHSQKMSDDETTENTGGQTTQPTIPVGLSKKLVQELCPPEMSSKKMTSDAAASALSEVIRRFVVEVHSRATIEVQNVEFCLFVCVCVCVCVWIRFLRIFVQILYFTY